MTKMSEDITAVEHQGDMGPILDDSSSNEREIRALRVMSEHQALKDAEAAVRTKIESSDSEKFGDYKKIMKVLYDKMFENQTATLKMG